MKIDTTMSFLDDSTKAFLDLKVQYLIKQLPNLEYVVLFGSHARAEQTISSDIDLMAITLGLPERSLRGDLCSRFEEDHIDLIFYDLTVFRNSNCLLVSQVKKEGIILWRKK